MIMTKELLKIIVLRKETRLLLETMKIMIMITLQVIIMIMRITSIMIMGMATRRDICILNINDHASEQKEVCEESNVNTFQNARNCVFFFVFCFF